MRYADRFSRIFISGHCRGIALPSSKDLVDALTTKSLRRPVISGKRRGRGFAQILGVYADMCSDARRQLRRLVRGPQGDATEQRKLAVVGEPRAQWADGLVSMYGPKPPPTLSDRVVSDGTKRQKEQAVRSIHPNFRPGV